MRHAGPCGGRQVNFPPRLSQHAGSSTDFALAPGRTPSRYRIVDEDALFQFWIIDFGFWIEASHLTTVPPPVLKVEYKSKIKSGHIILDFRFGILD
jgi:hypothetical protein